MPGPNIAGKFLKVLRNQIPSKSIQMCLISFIFYIVFTLPDLHLSLQIFHLLINSCLLECINELLFVHLCPYVNLLFLPHCAVCYSWQNSPLVAL